jgi:hypothetical protein
MHQLLCFCGCSTTLNQHDYMRIVDKSACCREMTSYAFAAVYFSKLHRPMHVSKGVMYAFSFKPRIGKVYSLSLFIK